MNINKTKYQQIQTWLQEKNVTLVAVSKGKPVGKIQDMYSLGQRDFGENYVQELIDKQRQLPEDIRWHFIGHLQTNKVKHIVPFLHLIQSVDSFKLLKEIDKEGKKYNRTISVLLQVHIAQEETKFGLDETEFEQILKVFSIAPMQNVIISGFMGMASFTENSDQVRNEFRNLKKLFDKYVLLSTAHCPLSTLSMGMSADYEIAVEEGSNMVRIGSLIFGERAQDK